MIALIEQGYVPAFLLGYALSPRRDEFYYNHYIRVPDPGTIIYTTLTTEFDIRPYRLKTPLQRSSVGSYSVRLSVVDVPYAILYTEVKSVSWYWLILRG